MKKLLRFTSSMVTMMLILFSSVSFAQTVLVNPTAEGGFEVGTTLTDNGWTAVNATTDGWVVGNAPVVASGSNCGYVSADGGAAWTYSQTSTFTHIYRDFTVPAGESKVTLSFKWKANGEGTTTTDWDNMKIFLAPTSVVPTTAAAVAGATQLSGAGSTSGMYKLNSAAWNNESFSFSATPGTTYRLIFSWKSDGSTIANPPAALDDISVVSSVPGNFISIVTGNWTSPSTWDANAVPSAADNVTVSTGHVVTIDAASQAANNLIVNGTLGYGATPTAFNVYGNLTVNTGGIFNVFNSTTGKTLTVTGNIINDGSIDVSVGTTTAGNLTLNGSTVQTVSGSGTFGSSNVIRNLTFSNTNTSTPNINWSINNVKVAYNLNLTGAKINLGTNKLTYGYNAAGNSLTAPVGTGFLSGTFSRYWTTAATGSAITAGTDPTNTTSRYPFLSPTALNRAMYISRTGTSTGATAGELSVTYVDASAMTTGLTIADGAYTVTDQHNANWTVTAGAGYSWPGTYTVVILDQSAFLPLNGNSRITLQNTALGGTHQNGTTTPGAQRTGLTTAQLTAGALYVGVNTLDNQYPCTGTPSPAAAVSSVTNACSAVNFTLSLQTPMVGIGYTYQWQSSADNNAFTDIAGATSATYTANQTVATYYRCNVTCSGNTGSSASVSVGMNPFYNCYCIPTISSGCTEGDVIARVILNTLDNNSGTGCPSGVGGNGYSNYTTNPALTTTLLPSTTYNCTVYAGQYSEGYAAWIDYNDDGVFDNTTERIGYSNGQVAGSNSVGVLGSSATFPIVLACTPPAGQHRLRVRAMYATNGSAVTPCANNSYGEVEDYLITIAAPPACPSTGAPTTVTTDSYTATVSFPLNCATATNYDFEYGPVGFTPGTGTLVSNQAVTIASGTATYTLTGLNALTTYDIYVRANCGTSTSTWSVATTATTLEPPCSGTPNTATASFVGPDAICNGGTALMTTSGATSGVLQLSNQWEMSTNNVNWTPITGANLQTYQTGTMAAGTYYFRYVSTCLATTQSSTSNAITLTVYAPPTITVSAPNNGVICGTQTITASGASTYVWSPASALSSTTGTSVTYTATSNNSITVTGTDANGCVGTSAPYAITYSAPTAISATSSTANFCGVGGNTTITATSSAPYAYTFTPLAGATVNSSTANTADLTVTATATIRVDGVDANTGCAAQTFVSVGVYPLPTANLTTDVNGICPGTNANINSGLTAGNFTVASIPYAASTAPANAGVLMNNGTATTALAGGSMDDGGWSNIPIGFTFNYFGSNFTTISAGTNGLLMFGTPSGYGTASGQLGQFTFQGPPYFPNTGNPANIIALLAADMHMGNSTTGSVKYWTEGYAPNRVFVIEYYNVRGYSSNPQATVQCKLYETLGNVEVHLFEKTFSNSAIIGLQDATQTIGAVAPGRTGAWTTTTPEGWRFTPPSNYTTVWTATNTTGTSTIASGTNIFTQAVSPTETTTYDISYTNQTTGCSNAAGSAQTTIAVLGTVAPSNVNAIASDSSVCSGNDFQLSMDYTGSLDGLSFQWQYSTDNGQTFNSLTGATTSVYTTNVTVPTIFRLEIISCGGTPAYSSIVSVTLNAPTDCYCVPTMTYGCADGDVVAGVKLNTLTNITGTACASGNLGYADYTTDATLTTTLVPSTSYFCTVFAGDFSGNYAAWIDYNDDGVFDASERIGYTTSSVAAGDSVNFPVNISCNPNPGVHRLRVREVFGTSGVSIDPCASYLWGETEDYLITLAPAPTCPSPGLVTSSTSTTTTADLAWPLGCATATNYDIEYGPSGFAQGTGTLLANTAVTITGTNASYTLTGLTPNSSYDVYVRANCGGGDVSPWSIGTTVTTSCAPITLNNPGTQTACDSFTLPAITETTPSNNANMTMGYYNNPFGSGTPITGAVTTGQMLYIYASAGACSASASFNVVINHTSSSSSQMTACDSYTWNGTTYTTSGTYTHVTQNAAGCDSTATLNLTINHSSTSTINAVACQSYTLNNVNYTTSGTYTQVVQNAVGCDSTITLNLTIGAPDAVTVNHTACDSYTWNGTTYTTGGTYTANLQNIYGCDSIVTLNLTINHSTTSSTTVSNCGAYTWNGQTYSASGTYTYHTTNASGCDSTATLVLTIGNNGSTQTAATCGSFTWSNGVTYTASGTYTQVVPNAAGCDSTITLNLTIYPLPNVTATDNGNGTLTASAGTTYQWINCQTNLPIGGATSQSLTVTQNGNYAVIVGNANNCTDTSNCVVVDYIGLDENSGFSLNVYPNPTDSKVTIAIDGSSNEFDVVVEDMNGRTVAKFNKLIHGNGNYDVNLNNLVTGVYFIKLTNGVEQRTVRVVKQ